MDGPHFVYILSSSDGYLGCLCLSAVANSEELLLNVGKDEKERGHSQQ